MQVSCFNDMCGDYFDMLHVRVGEMPSKVWGEKREGSSGSLHKTRVRGCWARVVQGSVGQLWQG